MFKHETLIEVVKRTHWGDWVKMRIERTGKIITVFIPRGK